MRELLNNKELLFLSKEKLSIWKELINLSFSNLKDYSKEERYFDNKIRGH